MKLLKLSFMTAAAGACFAISSCATNTSSSAEGTTHSCSCKAGACGCSEKGSCGCKGKTKKSCCGSCGKAGHAAAVKSPVKKTGG